MGVRKLRKKVWQYLRRREPDWLYREMAENAVPESMQAFYLEEGFPVLYVNRGMAIYLGYGSAAEYKVAIASRFEESIYPEDREYVRKEIEYQLEGRKRFAVEFRVLKKDGSYLWVHGSGRKMETAEESKRCAVICTFYDITVEKTSAISQKMHLDQMENLINHVPGGIGLFQWDGLQLKIFTLNTEFCKMLGVTEQEERIRFAHDNFYRVHEEDREEVEKKIKGGLISGESINITARVRCETTQEYRWLKMGVNIVEQEDRTKLCYVSCIDVTREKQLEEELKVSERSLRIALDNCGIYSGRYDLLKNSTKINRKLQEDFGLPKVLNKSSIGKNGTGVISRQGKEKLRQIAQDIREGRIDTGSIEVKMKKPGQEEWIWTKQTYTVVQRDGEGRALSVIGTAVDITRQKLDEQRFSEESVYHNVLLKDTLSAVRMNISEWRMLDYSGERSLDFNFGESIFQTMEKHIVDMEMREHFRETFCYAHLLRAFQQGENTVSYIYRSRRMDGKIIWVKTSVDMFQHSNGNIMGLVIVKDVDRQVITDLVRSQLIDDVMDFVAYENIDSGDCQILSEKWDYIQERPEGQDGLEYLMHQFLEKIVPEEKEDAKKALDIDVMRKNIQGGKQCPFVYHMKDELFGTRIKRLTYYPLNTELNVVVIIQRDITDIIAEEETQNLELQNALSIANSACHAKNEFMSRMSHDLRTPLNGIIGASNLALMEWENSEAVKEYLGDIRNSGHLMLSLVNDILDMNRMESGKLQLNYDYFTQDELIRDLRLMFEPLCQGKGIHLILEKREDDHIVYTDPVCLKRIFYNLLSNAVKFTPEGGSVEYCVTERKTLGDTYFVTMAVRDNGVGMSEEFQKHMYDTFTQEQNNVNAQNIGTGLGLSITKNLVELMGGFLSCRSKQGEGTEFQITIPFKLAQKEKEIVKDEVEVDEEILHGRRILLVEDHPLNAKIMIRILEDKGIIVKHAADGKKAVEMFQATEPFSYDAILMDIKMPVMDGLEATRQIRNLWRSDGRMVPIIAMTANVFENDIQQSKAAGMNDHLEKPVNPKKLFQTLITFWKG